MTGIIKTFREGGFGFIRYVDNNVVKEVYYHVQNYSNPTGSIPMVGERVEFSFGPSKTPNKPDQAIHIRPVEPLQAADLLSGKSDEAVSK
jgi:cold shock CspA family protein